MPFVLEVFIRVVPFVQLYILVGGIGKVTTTAEPQIVIEEALIQEGLPYRVGQQLKLLVASCPPMRAIVRWTKDGEAGIAFLRPLTDAQVEHLHNPDAACASLDKTWNPLEGVTPAAQLRRAC